MLRLVTAEEVAVAAVEASGAEEEVTLTGVEDETDVAFTTVPGDTCCEWLVDFVCGGDALNKGRRLCRAFGEEQQRAIGNRRLNQSKSPNNRINFNRKVLKSTCDGIDSVLDGKKYNSRLMRGNVMVLVNI